MRVVRIDVNGDAAEIFEIYGNVPEIEDDLRNQEHPELRLLIPNSTVKDGPGLLVILSRAEARSLAVKVHNAVERSKPIPKGLRR